MAYCGYNEAKKRANEKYNSKFERITFRITQDEKRQIEKLASAAGKSVNQYLKDCALGK